MAMEAISKFYKKSKIWEGLKRIPEGDWGLSKMLVFYYSPSYSVFAESCRYENE